MHRLASLETPIVRDLAYACFDTPLIEDFSPFFTASEQTQQPTNCHLKLTDDRVQWLQALDKNPKKLVHHLNKQQQTRLGYYYESLWHFFIEQDPDITLITNNHKVYDNKKTLGEIDIIYQCLHTKQFFHLELAIKFYMQTGKKPESLEHYYGSNQRDRFHLKLNKLLHHQSQFCINKHQKKINHLWQKEIIKNEIALHGFLFYPLHSQQKNPIVNAHHNHGQWLPLFKFMEIINNHEYWAPMQRLKWISPSYNPTQAIYSKKNIAYYMKQYIENIDDSLMISGLKKTNSNLIEERRYIITPDHWADKIYYTNTEY